jgi:hypothetical protein
MKVFDPGQGSPNHGRSTYTYLKKINHPKRKEKTHIKTN